MSLEEEIDEIDDYMKLLVGQNKLSNEQYIVLRDIIRRGQRENNLRDIIKEIDNNAFIPFGIKERIIRTLQFLDHVKSYGLNEIDDLNTRELVSLKGTLVEAINNNKPVRVIIDSKQPEEILKGTYVAQTLSKRGYMCDINVQADNINWNCTPPE